MFSAVRLFATAMLLLLSAVPAAADSVEPLLGDCVRHQSAPFNNRCPQWIEKGVPTGDRCLVGCVATALESIISYYGREITLLEPLQGWSTANYAVESLPEGTFIDAAAILPDYGDGTAQSVGCSEEEYQQAVDAVSTLSLACGIMAKMNYGVNESGADTQNLVEPLKNALGWQTALLVDSYNYSPEQWVNLLKSELRAGRPVLYTGHNMNLSGHAFVIDGYNEEGKFHVNWGYGGRFDEFYYDILTLCPFENPLDPTPMGIMHGFFCNQQALILCPDAIDTGMAEAVQPRTGLEIVVEDIEMPERAGTGKFVPVTVTLRNTSDQCITSPFEIFSNTPYDTDLFKEGDYGALFGVTMEPGEVRTLTVHCKFDKSGTRTVHLSPDDVHVFGNKRVTFEKSGEDKLFFGEIEIFGGENSAFFRIPVTNDGTTVSGSQVTYSLFDNPEKKTDTDWRHFDYIYVNPGETQRVEVAFNALERQREYVFALRWPWEIRKEYRFTLDAVTGVGAVSPAKPAADVWYDLLGRGVSREKGGLLIHNGRKVLQRR